MCGWFLQVKNWVLPSLLCCCPHRGCSVESIFHSRKIDCLTKLSVMEILVPIGGFWKLTHMLTPGAPFFCLYPQHREPGYCLVIWEWRMEVALFKSVWCEMVLMTLEMSQNTYPTCQYLPHEACTLEHFLVYLCAVSKWELASCRDFSFHASLHREWKQQDGSFRGFCWHLAASGCLNRWCH